MTDPIPHPCLREAPQPAPTTTTRAASPPKPAAPVEQVQARCGHATPMQLYPDGRDKFRDSRRKNIGDRDCPECRRKAHEERTRAETEATRGRRKRGRQLARQRRERLPHGSRFDQLLWDAEKGLWAGTLTVPVEGGEPMAFTASGGGVFTLLRTLDGMHRDATAAKPAGGE